MPIGSVTDRVAQRHMTLTIATREIELELAEMLRLKAMRVLQQRSGCGVVTKLALVQGRGGSVKRIASTTNRLVDTSIGMALTGGDVLPISVDVDGFLNGSGKRQF